MNTEAKIQIRQTDFELVLPVWRDRLWPGRESKIEAISHIALEGGYDATLAHANPFFWKAEDLSGTLLGVISGFATSPNMFRSRGIWVDPLWRKCGIGRKLLAEIHQFANSSGYSAVWTMPRKSAWPFYQACGYKIVRESNEFEFGPHYFAIHNLTH